MSKETALVKVGSGGTALARPAGAGVVEFDDEVRQLITQLAPTDGGLNLSPELVGAVEEITKYLAPFLPWLTVPLALIPGVKKVLSRRRFKKLLGQVLIHVLRPDTPLSELNDVRTVVKLGKLVDLEVTVELAEEVLGLVPQLLKQPAVRKYLESLALGRYLDYVERRVRVASGQPDSNDQLVQIAVANTLSTIMRIQGSGGQKQLGPLLDAIGAVCAAHLDEPRATVDVNVMLPVDDKNVVQAECAKNVDAQKAFGGSYYEEADVILRVRASTNPRYVGFWLPVFSEMSALMPGAAAAYTTLTVQPVFTRQVGPHSFGEKHRPEDVKRIVTYLHNVPFKVFLSFPMSRHGGGLAVININIAQDEIKLYNRAELLRLQHTLMPYFAAVDLTLG